MPQERRKYGKKDYENKKLCNFRSKKLKRKYLQIFHGKKIYIGNYSDRTRADISYKLYPMCLLYIAYIQQDCMTIQVHDTQVMRKNVYAVGRKY